MFKGIAVAIVDDDPAAVEVLAALLGKVAGIVPVATGLSSADARRIAGGTKPDILFLDIELNGGSALEIIEALREASPRTKIVFYTAYRKYLINALRMYAFDFLLKPVEEEELLLILHRFVKERKDTGAACDMTAKGNLFGGKRALSIMTITNDRIIVGIQDIVYFKYHSERKLWEVVLSDFRHHILRRQTTAETILTQYPEFARTHKQFIVNLSYISMISPEKCVLLPPFDKVSEIRISKNYRKELLDKFYEI